MNKALVLFPLLFTFTAVAQLGVSRSQDPITKNSAIRPSLETSPIWGGYVVEGRKADSVTLVTGSWVAPTIDCSGSNVSQSLLFLGMGGFTASPVEQIGTDAACVKGRATYKAWYEFLPNQQSQQPIPLLISAGDHILATVKYDGGHFTMTLLDENTGKSSGPIHEPQGFSGDRSSAEWIVEASPPSVPLSDFGAAIFGQKYKNQSNACSATVDGKTAPIGGFGSNVVTLELSNTLSEAIPSSLSNKSGFSVLQYAGEVLADNPVAYYRLGEKGGTLAADSSTDQNNGTYENGPALGAPGLIVKTTNKAVNFFAGDVVIPDSPSLNFVSAPFTIEAWVNGTYAIQMRVFDKIQAGLGSGYGLDLANDNVRIVGNLDFAVATTLIPNTTYYIVATSDGLGTGSVYLNGVLVGAGAYTSALPYTEPAHIAEASDGTAHFDGVIDEVAVYNHVLPASRILVHYQVGTGQ